MKTYKLKENDLFLSKEGVFCFDWSCSENIPNFLTINETNNIHECYLINAKYSTKSNEYIVLYKKRK